MEHAHLAGDRRPIAQPVGPHDGNQGTAVSKKQIGLHGVAGGVPIVISHTTFKTFFNKKK
jgi:hypothetical protein